MPNGAPIAACVIRRGRSRQTGEQNAATATRGSQGRRFEWLVLNASAAAVARAAR
jgi:hypothetical protein